MSTAHSQQLSRSDSIKDSSCRQGFEFIDKHSICAMLSNSHTTKWQYEVRSVCSNRF